jgi:hypothetical protein
VGWSGVKPFSGGGGELDAESSVRSSAAIYPALASAPLRLRMRCCTVFSWFRVEGAWLLYVLCTDIEGGMQNEACGPHPSIHDLICMFIFMFMFILQYCMLHAIQVPVQMFGYAA